MYGPVNSDAGQRSIPIPDWLREEQAAGLAVCAPIQRHDPLIVNKQAGPSGQPGHLPGQGGATGAARRGAGADTGSLEPFAPGSRGMARHRRRVRRSPTLRPFPDRFSGGRARTPAFCRGRDPSRGRHPAPEAMASSRRRPHRGARLGPARGQLPRGGRQGPGGHDVKPPPTRRPPAPAQGAAGSDNRRRPNAGSTGRSRPLPAAGSGTPSTTPNGPSGSPRLVPPTPGRPTPGGIARYEPHSNNHSEWSRAGRPGGPPPEGARPRPDDPSTDAAVRIQNRFMTRVGHAGHKIVAHNRQ